MDTSLLHFLYYPWRILQNLPQSRKLLQQIRDEEFEKRNAQLKIDLASRSTRLKCRHCEDTFEEYRSRYIDPPQPLEKVHPKINLGRLDPNIYESIRQMAIAQRQKIVPRCPERLPKSGQIAGQRYWPGDEIWGIESES